jgi:hypothetical protein
MGAGVAVVGEGMGLTRGGRESPREHGADGAVPLGREGKGERASGARCLQGGQGWQREGEREERARVGRRGQAGSACQGGVDALVRARMGQGRDGPAGLN